MKQTKRNFVIEYKSGRRRSSTTQSSSIWGSFDLKSVAQAVETDMPKPATGIDRHAIDTPSKHLAQDIVAETNAPASVTAPPDSEDVVAGVSTGTPVDSDALADGEEPISANDAIGLAKGDATGETPRLEPTGA
ncbi:hypothetical protein [Rhizobium wenxiniae]|uniref:hypothetical protein n=1 Tax=Rhizobium wenxiniae TaxID=1737357 RepID=UPI003C13A784